MLLTINKHYIRIAKKGACFNSFSWMDVYTIHSFIHSFNNSWSLTDLWAYPKGHNLVISMENTISARGP
jgi:hypothetical protein